jgi:hypothetical protein
VFSNSRKEAFYQLQPGDTWQAGLDRFGAPIHVERAGVSVEHYPCTPCAAPCAERRWFENRLNSELEMWSVALNRHGRVMDGVRGEKYLVSL